MKQKLKSTAPLNAALLVAVAALGFFAAQAFEQTPPDGARPTLIKAPVRSEDSALAGMPAPDFSLEDINGRAVSLSDYKGKIILLNFWATWCPPCIKEFPLLLELARDNPDDVVLFALSSDFEEDALFRFLQKQDIPENAPNIVIAMEGSDNITQSLYQTYALPETIIIDKSLVMHSKVVGADWDKQVLQTTIDRLKD